MGSKPILRLKVIKRNAVESGNLSSGSVRRDDSQRFSTPRRFEAQPKERFKPKAFFLQDFYDFLKNLSLTVECRPGVLRAKKRMSIAW